MKTRKIYKMSDCINGHIKIYGHIVYKVIHFHYVIYSNPRHVLTFDTVTPKSIGFLCYPGWMCGQSLRKIGQGFLECYRIGKCLQPIIMWQHSKMKSLVFVISNSFLSRLIVISIQCERKIGNNEVCQVRNLPITAHLKLKNLLLWTFFKPTIIIRLLVLNKICTPNKTF